ncbi:hypothetical protein ACF5W4_05415 [Bacillota bacterium Lsc_1132]
MSECVIKKWVIGEAGRREGMKFKNRITNGNLQRFLLKNGMFSIGISVIIVLSIMYMLHVDVQYQNALPIIFFVLMLITVFL